MHPLRQYFERKSHIGQNAIESKKLKALNIILV